MIPAESPPKILRASVSYRRIRHVRPHGQERWSWTLYYGNMPLITQGGFATEKIARQSFEMVQRCVAYLRGEN